MNEASQVSRVRAGLLYKSVRFEACGNQHFGGAAASVGPVKQQRLWRSASFYLLKFPKPPACRFDLVAIDGNDLRWMKNIRLSAR